MVVLGAITSVVVVAPVACLRAQFFSVLQHIRSPSVPGQQMEMVTGHGWESTLPLVAVQDHKMVRGPEDSMAARVGAGVVLSTQWREHLVAGCRGRVMTVPIQTRVAAVVQVEHPLPRLVVLV
jgi:hypothetical protein